MANYYTYTLILAACMLLQSWILCIEQNFELKRFSNSSNTRNLRIIMSKNINIYHQKCSDELSTSFNYLNSIRNSCLECAKCDKFLVHLHNLYYNIYLNDIIYFFISAKIISVFNMLSNLGPTAIYMV